MRAIQFAGLVGIRDPPRPGVADTVRGVRARAPRARVVARCSLPTRARVSAQILKLQASGVYVAMITGDSRDTAVAIARSLNILAPHEGETDDVCMSGQEVDALPDLSTPASSKKARGPARLCFSFILDAREV